jgi:hypothetical protein
MYQMHPEDASIFSDLFKDVNGFRPRGTLHEFNSKAEFDLAFERLQVRLDEQQEEQKEIDAHSIRAYNARIASLMQDHSIDRATAVRWDMEAEGADGQDMDYYLFLVHLPYGYDPLTC